MHTVRPSKQQETQPGSFGGEDYVSGQPRSLFGLVGMGRMNLLQPDHPIHDVEPDSCVAIEGWLVLPSFMGGNITRHQTQITA